MNTLETFIPGSFVVEWFKENKDVPFYSRDYKDFAGVTILDIVKTFAEFAGVVTLYQLTEKLIK